MTVLGVLLVAVLVVAAVVPQVHKPLHRWARGRVICALCDAFLIDWRERQWGLCMRHAQALRAAMQRDEERRARDQS